MEKQTYSNVDNDSLSRNNRSRDERLANLVGRYVVQKDSLLHPGLVIYYKNRSLCDRRRYWTAHLDQAQGFDTEKAANRMLRHLRFNNPRIVKVTENLCACA